MSKLKYIKLENREELVDDSGLSPRNRIIQETRRPGITTRLVPKDNRRSISAKTIAEVMSATEKVLQYSAADLAFGSQPEFSNLNKVQRPLLDLGRLEIVALKNGSFVIDGEIAEAEATVTDNGVDRVVSATQLVERFYNVATGINNVSVNSELSIGMLNAIASLKQSFKRDTSLVEYYPTGGSFGNTADPRKVSIDTEYVERIANVAAARRQRSEEERTIRGRLFAVDMIKLEFTLKHETVNGFNDVSGRFNEALHDAVIRCIDKIVDVTGSVTLENQTVKFIEAVGLEDIEGD